MRLSRSILSPKHVWKGAYSILSLHSFDALSTNHWISETLKMRKSNARHHLLSTQDRWWIRESCLACRLPKEYDLWTFWTMNSRSSICNRSPNSHGRSCVLAADAFPISSSAIRNQRWLLKVTSKRTYGFGLPSIGNHEPRSRIHRHYQACPMESVPIQEAIVATFFDLGILVFAYLVKAASKSFPGPSWVEDY